MLPCRGTKEPYLSDDDDDDLEDDDYAVCGRRGTRSSGAAQNLEGLVRVSGTSAKKSFTSENRRTSQIGLKLMSENMYFESSSLSAMDTLLLLRLRGRDRPQVCGQPRSCGIPDDV